MTAYITLLLAIVAPGPDQPAKEEAADLADYPCGLTSFYLVCRILDVPIDWEKAKETLGPTNAEGTHSFEDLARAAEAVGLHPVGLRTSVGQLDRLPMPAIAQVRDRSRAGTPPHLLVLLKSQDSTVMVLDPPGPSYSIPHDEFERAWTGNIMIFPPSEGAADEFRRAGWRNTVSKGCLLGAVAVAILALAGLVFRRRSSIPWREVLTAGGSFATLALVVCLLALLITRLQGSPLCVIPQAEIDLGELEPGTFATQVPIQNAGTGQLRIKKVRSSCTCASVTSPRAIQAGVTAMIDVELNVFRGPQRALLTIDTYDGEKTISLFWQGKSTPALHPVYISSRFAPANRPFEKTLQLLYPGGANAIRPVFESLEADSAYITMTEGDLHAEAQSLSGGRQFGALDLHLSITPPAPGAFIEKECRFTVRQGQDIYRLGFLVSVRFLGGQVTPESGGVLFTGATPRDLVNQERVLRVTVADYAGEMEVSPLPAWISCQQEEARPNARLLRFRVTRPPDAGFVSHTLQLSIPGVEESRVPVVVHALALSNEPTKTRE